MSEFNRLATAFRNFGDLFSDLTDLFGKELRLAKSELKQGVANLTQAAAFFAGAALIALFALMLFLFGIVHLIASFGLALHWSFLLVSVLLFALAGAAVYMGRAKATPENLVPRRTLVQLGETAKTLKEQLR